MLIIIGGHGPFHWGLPLGPEIASSALIHCEVEKSMSGGLGTRGLGRLAPYIHGCQALKSVFFQRNLLVSVAMNRL
jgi:hypothetical protein